MSLVRALQAKSQPPPLGWGTRDFTGPSAFSAAVDELDIVDGMYAQLQAILTPWDQYRIQIPAGGAYTSFEAMLAASKLYDAQDVAYSSKNDMKKDMIVGFRDALLAAARMIDNAGVVKSYGQAEHSKHFEFIAKKFKKDHLALNKKEAKAHAEARLAANASVPASTSVLREYANGINKHTEELNKAGVFGAVDWYLNTVLGWQPTDALVDSIGWFCKHRVTAYTYTRGPRGLVEKSTSGYLMYAAQADATNPKQQIVYHYSAIETKPDDPLSFARSPRNGPWTKLDVEAVIAKLAKLDPPQVKALRENWPIVYYSI